MDELREIDKKRFPLTAINDVVGLFEDQLKSNVEPNLTLLSIVLGIVEHSLTIKKPLDKRLRGRPNEQSALKNFDQNDEYNKLNSLNNHNNDGDDSSDDCEKIPTIKLADVNVLFELFVKLIKDNVDLSLFEHSKYTSTGLLKKVSDVLWTTLTRTFYKDKGHLQFLNTLFSEQKMDCFGMAFGVIAGCQILGLVDVHMAVTEDHVWAVHGKNGCLTSEITWHGKGTEDRRGNPVTMTAPENSWLYKWPMICNRYEEVAVLVVSINTVIHATLESYQMAALQKRILWMLFDMGHLMKYPIALSTLADLEEIQPYYNNNNDNNKNNNNNNDNNNVDATTNIKNNANIGVDSNKNNNNKSKNSNNVTMTTTTTNNNNNNDNAITLPNVNNNNSTEDNNNNNNVISKDDHKIKPKTCKRPSSFQLYKQAIAVSRTFFDDSKIYPHTYMGNYHYRRRRYKEALRSWADAAQVASCFNYNREDDEMYREFHEIANDIVPNIIRTCCAVLENNTNNNNNNSSNANINSSVPSSATNMTNSLKSHQKKGKKKSKGSVKSDDVVENNVNKNCISSNSTAGMNTNISNDGVVCYNDKIGVNGSDCAKVNTNQTDEIRDNLLKDQQRRNSTDVQHVASTPFNNTETSSTTTTAAQPTTTSSSTQSQMKIESATTTMATTTTTATTTTKTSKPSPSLILSDSDCYADILRFFDGICKWEEGSTMPVLHIIWANNMAYTVSKFLPVARANLRIFLKPEDLDNEVEDDDDDGDGGGRDDSVDVVGGDRDGQSRGDNSTVKIRRKRKLTKLLLRSHKMASMKDLFTCEKLNMSAIKLLLTAQSQVNSKSSCSQLSNVNNSRQGNVDGNQPARKRTRFNE